MLLVSLSVAMNVFGAGPAVTPVWYGPDGRPLPFDSHEEAVAFLESATVVGIEEIPGSQNGPLQILLERGEVRARAAFRSVRKTWRREWIRGTWYLHLLDRAASERAAYVVALKLGLESIPPTVVREIDGREGTLQLWVEEAETLAERAGRRLDVPADWYEQMATIRAFDALLFNVDRHPGNLLVRSDGVVWMIDHTQTFQYNERLLDADDVRMIPAVMWERLREIPDSEFEEALAETLDGDQIDAFLERRRLLVELIEDLIAEHGVGRVVGPRRGLGAR